MRIQIIAAKTQACNLFTELPQWFYHAVRELFHTRRQSIKSFGLILRLSPQMESKHTLHSREIQQNN